MVDWDSIVLAPAAAIFGEAVLYRPAQGQPFPIADAVYDANYTRSEIDKDGVTVTVAFPVIGVRAATVNAQQGDRVQIAATGENYAVAEVIPDGHGHVLLRLDYADAPA